jgi:hypothetical protein
MRLSRWLVIGVALVAACKKAEPPEPTTNPPDQTTPGVQSPDAKSARTPSGPPACSTLSRAACLESDHCTLELLGTNVYRCRADEGPCEIGLRQENKQGCAAKAECAFHAGECYCECGGGARKLGDCVCVCGGGPPSMCVERTKLAAKCATLSRENCLRSTICTLHLVGKGVYECRLDTGPCEVDIQQRDRTTCEAQKGCAWTAGEGYCACFGHGKTTVEDEETVARCGCAGTGGPPPMCSVK